ncbi:hypothetical protein BH10BAC5_BH10BAC5_03020 [soil metagenome]
MKRNLLFALSLICILTFTKSAFSQWSIDPLVNNFVTQNSGHQTHCQSVSDQKNGAIIVWEDDRFGGYDIYCQRINGGVNKWTPGGVKICGAGGDQIHPAICTDGAGGAFITWSDNRNGFGQVWCQRIKVDGTIMWADNGVLCSVENLNISHTLCYPAIQHSGSGCIVAMNCSDGVKAIKHNAFGEYEWGQSGGFYLRTICSGFAVNTCAGVQMCPDGGNGAHVCWSGHDGFALGHKVYAQHLRSDGTNHWAGSLGKRVCDYAPGHQKKPRICEDEVGGCEIVWEDGRLDTNFTTGRPNHDIYSERFDINGNHMWNSNGNPVCTDTADQTNPSCIKDTWEGMHCCWQDYRNYDAGIDSGKGVCIYAQNIHFDGHKRWTHNGRLGAIFCDVLKAQDPRYNPAMCANDDIGGFMICWLGYRNINAGVYTQFGVYAQRFDYDGNTQWVPPAPPFGGFPHGIAVCQAGGDKHSVTMCNNRTVTDDDNSGAVIAWTDDRNFGLTGSDIYAQHINSNSLLGDMTISNPGVNNSDRTGTLRQNKPNPFNPSTAITFSIPTNGFVSVKIYSMLGNEIATLVNGQMASGFHTVNWDASGLPSGTYFYKIEAGSFSKIMKMMLVK